MWMSGIVPPPFRPFWDSASAAPLPTNFERFIPPRIPNWPAAGAAAAASVAIATTRCESRMMRNVIVPPGRANGSGFRRRRHRHYQPAVVQMQVDLAMTGLLIDLHRALNWRCADFGVESGP